MVLSRLVNLGQEGIQLVLIMYHVTSADTVKAVKESSVSHDRDGKKEEEEYTLLRLAFKAQIMVWREESMEYRRPNSATRLKVSDSIAKGEHHII